MKVHQRIIVQKNGKQGRACVRAQSLFPLLPSLPPALSLPPTGLWVALVVMKTGLDIPCATFMVLNNKTNKQILSS